MEKKRELTKEEKEFQRDRLTTALVELNLSKKDRQIKLERVSEHLRLEVPKLEVEELLVKNEELFEKGFLNKQTNEYEEIPGVEKIKIKVEIEMIKKEIEIDLATLKAENQRNTIEKELKTLDKEIESTLQLIKQVR